MQKSHRQLTLAETMLPQQHFNNSKPRSAENQTVALENHIPFHTRQDSLYTFSEYKNMFVLTLTDITWNWFDPIMNNIPDIHSLKENS